jgi:hypothetical protein
MRIEIAVRALAHAPGQMHIQRQRTRSAFPARGARVLCAHGRGTARTRAAVPLAGTSRAPIGRARRAWRCRDDCGDSCPRDRVPPPSCASRARKNKGRSRIRRCLAAIRRCSPPTRRRRSGRRRPRAPRRTPTRSDSAPATAGRRGARSAAAAWHCWPHHRRRTRIARGIDAGRSTQGIHFQTRIVGNRRRAARGRGVPRLEQRVLEKGGAGFFGGGNAEIALRDDRSKGSPPASHETRAASRHCRWQSPATRATREPSVVTRRAH